MELTAKQRYVVLMKNIKISQEDNEEFETLFSQYNQAETTNKKDADMFLMTMYCNTARTKAAAACTYVENFLKENHGKVLVFAHHSVMINALSAHMEKLRVDFIKIDGGVTGDARAERIQSFQTNSSIRVAVLSIRACNAGITLTAASNVIFCELDWNPR
jgi:SWI/SNF-related matrix-associated actin-dependent regulator of chromatin subfamily A-like protein 1